MRVDREILLTIRRLRKIALTAAGVTGQIEEVNSIMYGPKAKDQSLGFASITAFASKSRLTDLKGATNAA